MEKEKEDLLEHYAKSENFDVNENANRYPGPTGFYSYVTEKVLGENVSIMPSDVVRMHFDGLIYVHKLPYSLYVPYCTGHSLLRLLE
ncbi:MAG: anaerobic ribonucleoside-triphosphate reductase, partial [Nitrososphaeria archaeon]